MVASLLLLSSSATRMRMGGLILKKSSHHHHYHNPPPPPPPPHHHHHHHHQAASGGPRRATPHHVFQAQQRQGGNSNSRNWLPSYHNSFVRHHHNGLLLHRRHHHHPPSLFPKTTTTNCNNYTRGLLLQQQQRRFIFGGGGSSSSGGQQQSSSSFSWKWSQFLKRAAWLIRTIRIPVVVLSVYNLGFQQGIIECTKHPEALQTQILQALVASNAGSTEARIHILSERDISFLNPHPHHQVATVGHRIVSAARGYVQENLETAIRNKWMQLPEDSTPEQVLEYLKRDDEFTFWYDAALRLMGEVNAGRLTSDVVGVVQQQQQQLKSAAQQPLAATSSKQQTKPSSHSITKLRHVPWQYVFVESGDPNAFVSEILPQKIFITTAMLELANTCPDELAMILGHEISHLILGHVTESGYIEMFLRTVEITLLSLDPTSGLLSLFIVGGLAWIRKAMSAAYSREHETEADDLGIVITARACYDTTKGAQIMYKMNQAHMAFMLPNAVDVTSSKKGGNASPPVVVGRSPTLLDTHPPTMERYERLLKQAQGGENYTKYQDKQCATMASRIAAAVLGGGGGIFGGASTSTTAKGPTTTAASQPKTKS